MEIGEIPVSLPSITKINDEINFIIKDNIHKYLTTVLDSIAEEHRIPRDILHEQYMSEEMLAQYCGTETRGKKTRKKISPEDQCRAKTGLDKRCTRKHKKGERFCGSHLNMNAEEFEDSGEPTKERVTHKKTVQINKKRTEQLDDLPDE